MRRGAQLILPPPLQVKQTKMDNPNKSKTAEYVNRYLVKGSSSEKPGLIVLSRHNTADKMRIALNEASKKVHKLGAIVVDGLGLRDDDSEAWRAWAGMREKYPKVETMYSPLTGVGVIMPNGKRLSGEYELTEVTMEQYRAQRAALMGPVMRKYIERGHH